MLMAASAVLFALMAVTLRFATVQVSAFEAGFFRSLFGLVFALPLLIKPGLGMLRTRSFGLYLVRGTTGTLSMLASFWALAHLPLAQALAAVELPVGEHQVAAPGQPGCQRLQHLRPPHRPRQVVEDAKGQHPIEGLGGQGAGPGRVEQVGLPKGQRRGQRLGRRVAPRAGEHGRAHIEAQVAGRARAGQRPAHLAVAAAHLQHVRAAGHAAEHARHPGGQARPGVGKVFRVVFVKRLVQRSQALRDGQVHVR